MSFIADEIFHLAFTLDDHLKLFGHGISKGGKIDGVQCYTEFSQRLLQFIDIAGSRHLVFFKQFQAFSLRYRCGKLPGCPKHEC